MKIIDETQVHKSLNFSHLVPLLNKAFANDFNMPPRHVYYLNPEKSDNNEGFALLPAWNDEVIGNKMFTYFPDNDMHAGLNRVYSKIMLFSRKTGEPLAFVDGTSVTYWRTAAVSALASKLLSRPNSRHFLLFGAGKLAPYLIHAHLSVRPIEQVTIIGRCTSNVKHLIDELAGIYPAVTFRTSFAIEQEVPTADIICCATTAKEPLFDGALLAPGTHLDCLGNHHQDQRECDSTSITHARVFVDSLTNCLNEAGEILLPIKEGVFAVDDIIGELSEMCKNPNLLRHTEHEITLFKSVGTAISDLATAYYVYQLVD